MSGDKSYMNKHLWELDQELFKIIQDEKSRQKEGLEMIASENYTSLSVMECLGSCLSNKYSEGLPNARYYGGNEFIDKIETLAQNRSLATFSLDATEWGVNVQPYSGSPANFAVYTGIVEPHGRIMGLDLPDGGHLTHGFYTPQKKVSATAMFFEPLPYKVDPQSGLIDYDQLAQSARLFRPRLIIAGISCYSRVLDYKRFKQIADDCGAYLMADMSHVSGLVAAKVIPSPFDYCDIVTTTTHKTLRGPRSGVIFFRNGVRLVKPTGEKVLYDLENRINAAVFPGLQGGPHNHQIAGIALCMAQAQTEEFKNYQQQVVKNAQALCKKLQEHGYNISAGGTDVHLILVNLKSVGLSGGKAEFILDEVNIACNKNTVPGDASALNPSGIRLGTPALTTRGMKEQDLYKVADFIDSTVKLGLEIQKKSGPKLVDFKKVALEDFKDKIEKLKNEVKEFALRFPLPGHDNY